ncbi:M20 aminoacylase family protein [Brucellaceae bacterium D45D]
MAIPDELKIIEPQMIAWRRHLHANPELGFEEHETAAFVEKNLSAWGIASERVTPTGVVATIKRGTSARSIGFRADMDALPIQEAGNTAWCSTKPGKMHACGHDGHTATLLAVAHYLQHHAVFDGTVHLIFQPAEEGLAGAKAMIDAGLFKRFPCDMVFGIHNDPLLALGQMSVVKGPVMAASDRFNIEIKGRGGHAARPQHSIDPLIAAAQVAVSLQGIISRRVDPLESAVLSITQFHSGSADNVIPDNAVLRGTVRTLKPYLQDEMEQLLAEVAPQAAATYGASADVTYTRGYPPVVNADAPTLVAATAACRTIDEADVLQNRPPAMGGEDFAFMAIEVPACFARVGTADGEKGSVPLHNSRYDYNDDALIISAGYFCNIVHEYLG